VSLVLAGGRRDQRSTLMELANSLGLGDRLHLLDWVEEEDLPALYAEALAFVYPSEYEGFGLQLVESMAVGCPTLAARATCLPEVLGDGGVTFSLGDPSELAALLRRVADDDAFRADLSARARARSAAFSWRRTAGETVAVYRDLLRLPRPPEGDLPSSDNWDTLSDGGRRP
jgi:glycosyltransferase involved in cell wall biosynthesis